MKLLYLWVKNEGWKSFEYENIEELKEEFGLRGIVIRAGAVIGERAVIIAGAVIGERAEIGAGAEPIIISINGSGHFVSYWGQDRIDIGCNKDSIKKWLDKYVEIGKNNGYSDQQIEEYGKYINLINSIHNG